MLDATRWMAGPAVSAFALLLATGCTGAPTPEPAPAAPPNIIYILADDLGYGDLGVYGQEKIETPNIDGLARSGLRFTQHYSGSPVCAPARGVLMTGLHTGHAYIRGNDEWRARGDVWDYEKMNADPGLEGQRPLPAGTRTLGRVLQDAGYDTAIVGKWGLGGPTTEGIPNEQGFDFFFGYNCQRQAHTYTPMHLWRNREKVSLNNNGVPPHTPLDEGADPNDPASYEKYALNDYAGDRLLEAALAFMDQERDGPFFLYYASPIPHLPLQAPEKWVKHYREKLGPEEPSKVERYFPHRTPRAAYAAMVSTLDEQVGRIMEKLDELGARDDTLVVFSSDNGPVWPGLLWGDDDTAFFQSARPFRSDRGWGKASVREGGIRVPMIACWPGHVAPGQTTDHISAFWDVLPTLAEVAGAVVPEDIDGISFAPTLLGRPEDQKEHPLLYWEFPAYGGLQAVRLGRWKGVRQNMFEGNMTIQLYDLEADPLEESDVAAEHPEVAARMEEIMRTERTPPEVEQFRFEVLGDGPAGS